MFFLPNKHSSMCAETRSGNDMVIFSYCLFYRGGDFFHQYMLPAIMVLPFTANNGRFFYHLPLDFFLAFAA